MFFHSALIYFSHYLNFNSKRRGAAKMADQTAINIPDFCLQIKTFVSQMIEADHLQKRAEVKLKKFVAQKFKDLKKDILDNNANKKYIIKTIIREFWPRILEQFFVLLQINKSIEWNEAEFQEKIQRFHEDLQSKIEADPEFEESDEGTNNKIFLLVHSNPILITFPILGKMIKDHLGKLTSAEKRTDAVKLARNALSKKLKRMYDKYILFAIFPKPPGEPKPKKKKAAESATLTASGNPPKTANVSGPQTTTKRKESFSDGSTSSESGSESNKKGSKKQRLDQEEGYNLKSSLSNFNLEESDEDENENEKVYDELDCLFPRISRIVKELKGEENLFKASLKLEKKYSTIVIPLVDQGNKILVTPFSFPDWISLNDQYVYDHIFALVGNNGKIGSGFTLFDRTIEFILKTPRLLEKLQSFSFLSFDENDVTKHSSLLRKTCNSLNAVSKLYFGPSTVQFDVKQIPAAYGGVEDDDKRLVISFVRHNSGRPLIDLPSSRMKETIPFVQNKRFKAVRDSDENGIALPEDRLYKLFDQVQLLKGQKIFDIGIGSLYLAVHGAHITGEDVHGNDVNQTLFEQLQNFFPSNKTNNTDNNNNNNTENNRKQ